ncbi:MAG: O-antigen ligase family protein [Parvibaculum sp.]|uniref:O-antigen ligase family protein n=1 Tax=Parvibaculum sp. TaxID=2024848 RepID=UPI0039188374
METAYSSSSRPYAHSLEASSVASGKWACIIFGLICASMFMDTQFHAAGARIRLFDMMFAIIVGLYALSVFVNRRVRRVPGQGFLIGFAVFTLYNTTNAVLLNSVPVAVRELLQALSFIAFFWVLKETLADERKFNIFLASFFAGIWALSLGNAAIYISSGTYFGFKDLGSIKLTHSYSLVLTVVIAGYWFGRKNVYLAIALIAIAVALTIMAGERKAWLAAIAAIIAASAFSESGRLATSKIAQRGLLLLAIAVPLILVAQASTERNYLAKQIESTLSAFDKMFNPSYDPLTDTRETISNRVRLYISDQAWKVFRENPVFGLGVNAFTDYIQKRTAHLPKAFIQGIHNEYLRLLAETGIVGFALYLAVLVIAIKRAVLCARSMPYLNHHLRLRTRMGIALLVFGLVTNAFRASTGLSVLVIFLPVAFLYFPAQVIRLPNGARRLMPYGASRRHAGPSSEPIHAGL